MWFFLVWTLFGAVCALAANEKNRSGCGWFILGVLLGPFALIAILVLSEPNQNSTRDKKTQQNFPELDFEEEKSFLIECPACGNDVSQEAETCPKCGQPMET